MAKDVPKQPAEAQAAHKPKDFVQLAQERAALGQQSFYATLKPASPVLVCDAFHLCSAPCAHEDGYL